MHIRGFPSHRPVVPTAFFSSAFILRRCEFHFSFLFTINIREENKSFLKLY